MRNGKRNGWQGAKKTIKHHNMKPPRVVLAVLSGFVIDKFTILCYNFIKTANQPYFSATNRVKTADDGRKEEPL